MSVKVSENGAPANRLQPQSAAIRTLASTPSSCSCWCCRSSPKPAGLPEAHFPHSCQPLPRSFNCLSCTHSIASLAPFAFLQRSLPARVFTRHTTRHHDKHELFSSCPLIVLPKPLFLPSLRPNRTRPTFFAASNQSTIGSNVLGSTSAHCRRFTAGFICLSDE